MQQRLFKFGPLSDPITSDKETAKVLLVAGESLIAHFEVQSTLVKTSPTSIANQQLKTDSDKKRM